MGATWRTQLERGRRDLRPRCSWWGLVRQPLRLVHGVHVSLLTAKQGGGRGTVHRLPWLHTGTHTQFAGSYNKHTK
jgi:hypothetical protein